jgi:hypothetical protein
MSPTSYQAAPPRFMTIAEVAARVKLPRIVEVSARTRRAL